MQCIAKNAAGEPCGAPDRLVDEATGLCTAHREGASERLAEAGRKGAEATKRKWKGKALDPDELPPLDSPQAAKQWLEVVGRAVASGRLTDRAGTAVTRSIEAWLKAQSAHAEEEELARLRGQIDELKGRTRLSVAK